MTDETTAPAEDESSTPDAGESDEGAVTAQDEQEQPESFDREYVQKLRDEAAGYRVKAKRTDALAAALVTAQAALTGKLADPTDLAYDENLLDDDGVPDADKVATAVADLIKRKPHLAARRPTGSVGQGARPEREEIGLATLLRRGA